MDLSAPVTLPGLEINIEKVVSHQSFTNNPVAIFDIALVKMERPVTFTDMIRPICVYQESQEEEVVEGELVVMAFLQDSSIILLELVVLLVKLLQIAVAVRVDLCDLVHLQVSLRLPVFESMHLLILFLPPL